MTMNITEAEKDWIESRRDEVSKILIESLKKLGHKNRPVISYESEVLHSTTLSSIHLSLTGSSLECIPRPQDITDSQATQTSPHVTISHLSDIEIPDVPKLDIKSLYILRDGCASQGLQCRYICSACRRPKESSQSDFDDSISILSKDSTKPRSTSNTTLLTPIKKSEPQLNVTKSSSTTTSSSLADCVDATENFVLKNLNLGLKSVHDDGSNSGGVLVISCTDPDLVAERIQEEEDEKKREKEARREAEEEMKRGAGESSSGEGSSKKKSSSEDELIMPPIALVRPSNKSKTPLRNPVMTSVSATIAHEDERRASFGFKMNLIPSASPTTTTTTTEEFKRKKPGFFKKLFRLKMSKK